MWGTHVYLVTFMQMKHRLQTRSYLRSWCVLLISRDLWLISPNLYSWRTNTKTGYSSLSTWKYQFSHDHWSQAMGKCPTRLEIQADLPLWIFVVSRIKTTKNKSTAAISYRTKHWISTDLYFHSSTTQLLASFIHTSIGLAYALPAC